MSIVSELKFTLLRILCIEPPEYTVDLRFSVSLAPSQENKSVVIFGLERAYFLAKFHATLLVQPACREVSSGGCSSKPGAQGFRS